MAPRDPKHQNDNQASDQESKISRLTTNPPSSCEQASCNSLNLQEGQAEDFALKILYFPFFLLPVPTHKEGF